MKRIGAVKRTATTVVPSAPESGHDRIAPMIGGLVASFPLELLVYPAVYKIWKRRTELKHLAAS